MNPNGLILWEGLSILDGAPIAVIVTGIKRPSGNRKVGPSLQVFYILQNIHPSTAVKTGADVAICGDCKHRPTLGGECYVKVWQAPRSVWETYRAGRYAHWDGDPAPFVGKHVRFGAYGDPASVPDACNARLDVIRSVAASTLAYTHQWSLREDLRGWVMASVDNVGEYVRARATGWRTFRVRQASEPVEAGERVCPAASEAPTSLQCIACRQCDGLGAASKRPSPVIVHHR